MAKARLSPGHYAHLATGTDHERGLYANRAGFGRFGLRPRRLVDVTDLARDSQPTGSPGPS